MSKGVLPDLEEGFRHCCQGKWAKVVIPLKTESAVTLDPTILRKYIPR